MDSYFHLFHVISHFPGADIINVELSVASQLDSFSNTGLEFALVEMHLVHIELHLVLVLLHAFIIFIESIFL